MKIAVELTKDQAEQLQQAAQRLGVQPEDLAHAALSDFLSRPDEDFAKAATYVLQKNRELYQRLG